MNERNFANPEPAGAHDRGAWARLAVAWGWLFLTVGGVASQTTLAGGDYRGVLMTARCCAGFAAVLLACGFSRGQSGARAFALLGSAPLVIIVCEVIRRT